MPTEITVPRQGWSMDEGVFIGWLKNEGDPIKEGEPIFSLESDKAAFDVESPGSGILRIAPAGPQPGGVVKVGAVLGLLLGEGDSVPAALPPPNVPAVTAELRDTAIPTPPESPRPPTGSPAQIPASPRARRAAHERQVDLADLRPTGTGGRIRERDVIAAGLQTAARAESDVAPVARALPITAQRRIIAGRMIDSVNNTAPVTLTSVCDATHLVSLRNQLKATVDSALVPSYTDIIAKLVARALRRHPVLAGRWEGDSILLPEVIHLGIAVDTEHGLLVPVVRNVESSSLWDLARQARDLIDAARRRKLKPTDMQGACFTITNLGGFGIGAFTPIINHPECAILGLGAIRAEPAVLANGQLGIREQLTLSLTFDHRVVDGAPAARFLQTLREGFENPAGWLLGEQSSPQPVVP